LVRTCKLHDYSSATSNGHFDRRLRSARLFSVPPCNGSHVRRGYSILGSSRDHRAGFNPPKSQARLRNGKWRTISAILIRIPSVRAGAPAGEFQPRSAFVGKVFPCRPAKTGHASTPTRSSSPNSLRTADSGKHRCPKSTNVAGFGNLTLTYLPPNGPKYENDPTSTTRNRRNASQRVWGESQLQQRRTSVKPTPPSFCLARDWLTKPKVPIQRLNGATGLTYLVQTSPDLATWERDPRRNTAPFDFIESVVSNSVRPLRIRGVYFP